VNLGSHAARAASGGSISRPVFFSMPTTIAKSEPVRPRWRFASPNARSRLAGPVYGAELDSRVDRGAKVGGVRDGDFTEGAWAASRSRARSIRGHGRHRAATRNTRFTSSLWGFLPRTEEGDADSR